MGIARNGDIVVMFMGTVGASKRRTPIVLKSASLRSDATAERAVTPSCPVSLTINGAHFVIALPFFKRHILLEVTDQATKRVVLADEIKPLSHSSIAR